MAAAAGWMFLCAITATPAAAEDQNISALIGQNVILPCRAERYQPFKVVEWSRPDSNLQYVCVFQNQGLKIPTPKYEGRVELKDVEKGDVSLILQNVTSEDRGKYECYVLGETGRRKRDIEPISTVYLDVLPPPGSSPGNKEDKGKMDGPDKPTGRGWIVGLVVGPLIVLIGLTAAFIWKKKNSSPLPDGDTENPL